MSAHMRFAAPQWRQHRNADGSDKLPWRNVAAAQAHANSLPGPPATAYRCAVCDLFHVGVRRNPLQWLADRIIDEIEVGPRAAAHLRAESLDARRAIAERFDTAARHRKRAA